MLLFPWLFGLAVMTWRIVHLNAYLFVFVGCTCMYTKRLLCRAPIELLSVELHPQSSRHMYNIYGQDTHTHTRIKMNEWIETYGDGDASKWVGIDVFDDSSAVSGRHSWQAARNGRVDIAAGQTTPPQRIGNRNGFGRYPPLHHRNHRRLPPNEQRRPRKMITFYSWQNIQITICKLFHIYWIYCCCEY